MTIFSSQGPREPRREYLECRHGDAPQGDGLDYCYSCRPVWVEIPHEQENPPNSVLVALRNAPVEEAEHAMRVLVRLKETLSA